MFSASNGVITNHEIECPKNKYIGHYLWNSYFHDSEIKKVKFKRKKKRVVLVVESIVDIDNAMKDVQGSRKYIRDLIRQNRDEFIYELEFIGCQYFHQESYENCREFLQSYFIDSARLRKIENEKKLPHYHVRILTSYGFLDIVFSDFRVKKKIGKVKIEKDFNYNSKEKWYQQFVENSIKLPYINSRGEVDIEELKKTLICGTDIERSKALYYLHNYSNESITANARETLNLDRDDYELSRSIAIRIIGKKGVRDDVSLLTNELLEIERERLSEENHYSDFLLYEQSIRDSIEFLLFKLS